MNRPKPSLDDFRRQNGAELLTSTPTTLLSIGSLVLGVVLMVWLSSSLSPPEDVVTAIEKAKQRKRQRLLEQQNQQPPEKKEEDDLPAPPPSAESFTEVLVGLPIEQSVDLEDFDLGQCSLKGNEDAVTEALSDVLKKVKAKVYLPRRRVEFEVALALGQSDAVPYQNNRYAFKKWQRRLKKTAQRYKRNGRLERIPSSALAYLAFCRALEVDTLATKRFGLPAKKIRWRISPNIGSKERKVSLQIRAFIYEKRRTKHVPSRLASRLP